MEPGGSRPSPHRPDQTNLGQYDRGYQDSGGRGGRSGRNTRRSDRRDSSQSSYGLNASAQASNPPPPPAFNTQRRPSASSQPALSPTVTASAPAAPPPAPPSPAPTTHIYAIITDDRVRTWTEGGRQEVVSHGVQSRSDLDATEVSAIYQELICSVLGTRLGATEAGSVVKEIVGDVTSDATSAPSAFDPRIIFLDTVSIFLEAEDTANATQLRDFMMATNISATLMRQVLDHEFLMRLGFLRDTFHRMTIRQSTNLLYRQQSYNLLREETEGFSKLVTELYTSSTTAGPEFTFETAQATFERVKGLIGTFDLDVGRVLDVTLDVFAATIIKQFKFFVKFLRISSWWPRDRTQHLAKSLLEGITEMGATGAGWW